MNSLIVEENRKQRAEQFKNFTSMTGISDEQIENFIHSSYEKPWDELKASQKRGRLLVDQFFKAFNKSPLDDEGKYNYVAWRSLFMPTEILYAFDMVPVTVEMAAAQISLSGFAVGRLEAAEGNHYSQDLCSFIKTGGGAIIENILPSPDILLTSTHLCDPGAKFAMYASHKYKRPEFVLDIPFGMWNRGPGQSSGSRIEDAVNYVAEQLEEMTEFIVRETGLPFSRSKLTEVINLANEASRWFRMGNDIAHESPGKVRASDMDYAIVLMQTLGTKEIVDVYRARYEEFLDAEDISEKNKHKPTVGWAHLRPYYSNKLLSYVEEHANIASNHVNYVFWDDMDETDPFKSLARKTVMHPGYCDVMTRAGTITRVADNIEGIIAFYPKSCRHYHSSSRIEQEIMKEHGVPMLVIDSDCIDNRGDDFLISKTRIDRFLKTLKRVRTSVA